MFITLQLNSGKTSNLELAEAKEYRASNVDNAQGEPSWGQTGSLLRLLYDISSYVMEFAMSLILYKATKGWRETKERVSEPPI